jgi:hypothetical protein
MTHTKEYEQEYRAKNREKLNAYAKAYRIAHKKEITAYNKTRNATPEAKAKLKIYNATPERKTYQHNYNKRPEIILKYKIRDLKRNFNLTLEQYDEMLLKQNNCCAICGRPASEFKRKLAVEHNHKTGKIRGLVCNKCNILCEYFDNNSGSIMKLASYFKRDEEDMKLIELLTVRI